MTTLLTAGDGSEEDFREYLATPIRWSAFLPTWKPPGAAIYFSLDQLFHLKTQVGVSGTPVTGESPGATCQPGKTVGPHHRWVVLLFVTTWFLKVSKQAKWVMHCFAFEKDNFSRWRESPSWSGENCFEKSTPETGRKVSCEEYNFDRPKCIRNE